MAMTNATEISRIVLVVSHPEKFDILTDILDDLSRVNTEGEVELG